MAQTQVFYNPPKAYEGMLASLNDQKVRGTIPKLVTSGTVYVGRAATFHATDKSLIKLPGASTEVFAGIVFPNNLQSATFEANLARSESPSTFAGWAIASGEPVGVMTEGDIWVWTEVAVAINDPVYFRHTAGTAPNDVLGRFSKTSGANVTLVPNAVFVTSTSAAGLAVISLKGF